MKWNHAFVCFCLLTPMALQGKVKSPDTTATSVDLPSSKPIELINPQANNMAQRPSLVSLYFGMAFADAYRNDKSDSLNGGIENEVFRRNEAIYVNSGSTFNRSKVFVFEPLIRLEFEKPLDFEKVWLLKNSQLLKSLKSFSAHFSMGAIVQVNRALSSTAQSDTRYLNPQAPNAALIDVTYQGSLAATESRSVLLPMVGLGYALALDQQKQWRLSAKGSLGAAFLSGERVARLATDAKYISAGAYTENYSISAEYRQNWQMSLAFAGQFDLGVRIEVFKGHHISILGSLLMVTGKLSMDQSGYFREQAGNRVTFQKNITGTVEERVFQWIPLASLAYSVEY